MNSRQKGARGERQWRDELRANGYSARRGQQFSGSPDSPDVISDALPWLHFEVKAVERLNIEDAMEQARRDCGGGTKVPVVAHKRNHRSWLLTMDADTFFKFLRGSLPPEAGDHTRPASPARTVSQSAPPPTAPCSDHQPSTNNNNQNTKHENQIQ